MLRAQHPSTYAPNLAIKPSRKPSRLTSLVISAGKRFGLDVESIGFTLDCLHCSKSKQTKQQYAGDKKLGDQPEDCIADQDDRNEEIEDELNSEHGEWEEDDSWEEEEDWDDDEEGEEEEEDWDEEQNWDEEKRAWASCLQRNGLLPKAHKPILRGVEKFNILIGKLKNLKGSERFVKALQDDRKRRLLLKANRQHWFDLLLQYAVPETVARSCVRDATDEAQLIANIHSHKLSGNSVERLLLLLSFPGKRAWLNVLLRHGLPAEQSKAVVSSIEGDVQSLEQTLRELPMTKDVAGMLIAQVCGEMSCCRATVNLCVSIGVCPRLLLWIVTITAALLAD